MIASTQGRPICQNGFDVLTERRAYGERFSTVFRLFFDCFSTELGLFLTHRIYATAPSQTVIHATRRPTSTVVPTKFNEISTRSPMNDVEFTPVFLDYSTENLVKSGDMSTSIIQTALGRTILLQHDVITAPSSSSRM